MDPRIQQQAELAPIYREQRNRAMDDAAVANAVANALRQKLELAEKRIAELTARVPGESQ